MSNFRTRILGLAAIATAFAGVSYGQALTCTDSVANANNANGVPTPAGSTQPQVNAALRVESQTDQLSLLQFACTGVSATSIPTTATVTIYTNLTITSKAISGLAAGANSEATLVQSGVVSSAGNVTLGAVGTATQGMVAGMSVTFANIIIPTSPAPGTTTYFQVTNIRVNSSSAATIPFQTTESGLISYTTSTTSGTTTAFASVPATNSSGLVVPSLAPPTITSVDPTSPYPVCVGNKTNTSFVLNINTAKVSGAFLLGTTAGPTGQPPVGEGGQYIPAGGGTTGIGAASADIISVTLANLPLGGTVYVPASVSDVSGTNGETLTTTGTAGTGTLATYIGFAVSSTGTVTIPYTVTAFTGLGAPAQSAFLVNVVVAFAANSTMTPSTVTATYNFSPQGATLTAPATAVPTFSSATPTAVSGVSIVLCQTTLLFPFVTNQLGFDTGIVLSNTSTDNLAGNNPLATPPVVGKSAASAQPGFCYLNFYGAGAPNPNTNVPAPGGSQASGTTNAFQLSSLAPGFQGYVISVCTYLYGHGYAFIEYNLTQGNGVAEGYLPLVITDRGTTSETLTN